MCARKVTKEIAATARPIYLTGIPAREVLRGWVTLEMPRLKQWERPSSWLTLRQRERIEDAAFFELLQTELPKRFPPIKPVEWP